MRRMSSTLISASGLHPLVSGSDNVLSEAMQVLESYRKFPERHCRTRNRPRRYCLSTLLLKNYQFAHLCLLRQSRSRSQKSHPATAGSCRSYNDYGVCPLLTKQVVRILRLPERSGGVDALLHIEVATLSELAAVSDLWSLDWSMRCSERLFQKAAGVKGKFEPRNWQ